MVVSPCTLLDLDRARLLALRAWNEQREYAVAVFRLDAIRLNLDWDGEGAIEDARHALAPVHARAFAVVDRLPTRDADGVFLRLHLQIGFVDAREFDHRNEIVALLEDVDGRVAAHGGDEIGREHV